jgi:hypothetical protein
MPTAVGHTVAGSQECRRFDGCYQLFLRFPWGSLSADELAARVIRCITIVPRNGTPHGTRSSR